jgi:predicted metal-dependent hydrolase
LIDRLNRLAQRHGFRYNRVFVRNQKTRWGSCSALNNISLNINLVRLPQELIDYTILHELVHTRIKNHSRRFWQELDKILGDAKQIDKKLSEYGALLI